VVEQVVGGPPDATALDCHRTEHEQDKPGSRMGYKTFVREHSVEPSRNTQADRDVQSNQEQDIVQANGAIPELPDREQQRQERGHHNHDHHQLERRVLTFVGKTGR